MVLWLEADSSVFEWVMTCHVSFSSHDIIEWSILLSGQHIFSFHALP